MKLAPGRFIGCQGDWPPGVLLLPVMERYAVRKITELLRVNAVFVMHMLSCALKI
tara:strand:- start:298 stop:462 length:165 start_codon:yes stop_codon:yes gene_type:complete